MVDLVPVHRERRITRFLGRFFPGRLLHTFKVRVEMPGTGRAMEATYVVHERRTDVVVRTNDPFYTPASIRGFLVLNEMNF